MSVYYKEKSEWLKLAIESMLNQTIKPAEFVLIKDGHLTDELEKVIENFVLENPTLFKVIALKKNVGLGLALRRGVLECSHELIARMDSDDYSHPNRIEKQLLEFEKDTKLCVCGCFENGFKNDVSNTVWVHMVPEHSEDIFHYMQRRCAMLHPTLVYKKSVIIEIGNYNDVHLFEDYDLLIRIIKNKKKCYNVQESLYFIRINDLFYKRRSGIHYLKKSYLFRIKYFKQGFFSLFDLIVAGGLQGFVCIMPVFIVKFIYKKVLRKKKDTK
jgi:glycosyltransferase involved in cell wall biosynthesis